MKTQATKLQTIKSTQLKITARIIWIKTIVLTAIKITIIRKRTMVIEKTTVLFRVDSKAVIWRT